MTRVQRQFMPFAGDLGPGAIYVPGQHLNRREATVWRWGEGRLSRLSISRAQETEALLPSLRARPLPFGFRDGPQFASFLLGPHAALPTPYGLVVSDRAGVDVYLVSGDESRPLVNEPGWAYASTPAIDGDSLLTARWPSESTGSGEALVELVRVPLNGGPARLVSSFRFGDFVHQVALSANGRHAVVTEMGMYADGSTLRSAVLRPSRVAVVDLIEGTASVSLAPHPAPAHVEVDAAGRVWLSCHNMGLFEAGNVLFGAGVLLRGVIEAGNLRFDATYTHPAFHRITTHQLLRWGGRAAVAVTVFPNAIEVLDAESLECMERVEVYPAAALPTGAVQRCDADRASPFSLFSRIDDELLLNGASHFYRLRRGAPVLSMPYNQDLAQHVGGHITGSEAPWA